MIRAEIGMLQKRLFYCRNCEIRLRSIFFLRQGYLRMSQQRNLPESMAWRVIGRLESGKHNIVSRTLLESPEVLLQVCGIDSKKQEMLDVDQRQVGHAPLHQLMTGIYNESRFSLECDIRPVLVWRNRDTRNNPAFVRERSQYKRADWKVWGGINIGGRTKLHIIRKCTLTGQRYEDEILQPHVIPYAGAIGDSFVFQDDNVRPHRARLVENMLDAETIQRMEWQACSPDLNPIEHVWDMLVRRIPARPRPPATVRDLEIPLLQEWNSIPQSLIDNLIPFMANSLNTSASTLSAETHPLTTPDKFNALSTETLPESVPSTSNSEPSNVPEIPQCVKRNSRNERKRPKVQKPEIEIKMAPHRPRKSAPTQLKTDDEDMITYEVEEEELEQDPPNKYTIKEDPLNFAKQYLR
ncbi:transposable element Tcb2 transposase [Trichonephila clavipes]|nr:transposable element Tcb2 transposase [Trichonephila clavipes]